MHTKAVSNAYEVGAKSSIIRCVTLTAQALADLLKLTHRGYFIPPRPEKNPVEGQRANQVRSLPPLCAVRDLTCIADEMCWGVLQEFVEARRAALQHYMEQLAQHPVISRSEVGDICRCIGRLFMAGPA